MRKRVFVLYGMAADGIPVCMFFRKRSHLQDFIQAVPGTYDAMKLRGIDYDDFTHHRHGFKQVPTS